MIRHRLPQAIQIAAQKQHPVRSRPSNKSVAGRRNEGRVRALQHRERVGDNLERVVACFAEEEIARQPIAPAGQHVVSGAAEDPVFAGTAHEHVVAGAAEEDVAALDVGTGSQVDYGRITGAKVEGQIVNRRNSVRRFDADQVSHTALQTCQRHGSGALRRQIDRHVTRFPDAWQDFVGKRASPVDGGSADLHQVITGGPSAHLDPPKRTGLCRGREQVALGVEQLHSQ